MPRRSLPRFSPVHAAAALAPILLLSGCGQTRGDSSGTEFQMGDRITVGPVTFNVVDAVWRSQLGNELNPRLPNDRFLLITLSATNGGGRDVSVPLLTLEGSNGKTYQEAENGDGIDHWFGLLRTLNPAQTQQGQLLFDVPLGTYRLKLSDGGESGAEHTATVTIPLRMDPETYSTPVPESPAGK